MSYIFQSKSHPPLNKKKDGDAKSKSGRGQSGGNSSSGDRKSSASSPKNTLISLKVRGVTRMGLVGVV